MLQRVLRVPWSFSAAAAARCCAEVARTRSHTRAHLEMRFQWARALLSSLVRSLARGASAADPRAALVRRNGVGPSSGWVALEASRRRLVVRPSLRGGAWGLAVRRLELPPARRCFTPCRAPVDACQLMRAEQARRVERSRWRRRRRAPARPARPRPQGGRAAPPPRSALADGGAAHVGLLGKLARSARDPMGEVVRLRR